MADTDNDRSNESGEEEETRVDTADMIPEEDEATTIGSSGPPPRESRTPSLAAASVASVDDSTTKQPDVASVGPDANITKFPAVRQGPVKPSVSTTRRVSPKVPIEKKNADAVAVLEQISTLYMKKLQPLESAFLFEKFHADLLTEADLNAKPHVLLLGQYSTGKTSLIQWLTGRESPGQVIGPEPTSEHFQVVMAGREECLIKGRALSVVDDLPYTGTVKFGEAFLDHFEGSVCPSLLLDHITFIDTPGILAGQAQSVDRGYPFVQATKWFADRSDLIILLFDAHKLEVSNEVRDVIDALHPHWDRVRIVLNKSHEVDADSLIKVYGALMWAVGRSFRHKGEAPKVFVGSFGESEGQESRDEIALLTEIMGLPKSIGHRKINDMMRRTKLLTVHIHILNELRSCIGWPLVWREAKQHALIATLHDIFEHVRIEHSIPIGDMPSIDVYRVALQNLDFRTFPKRTAATIAALTEVDKRIKEIILSSGGVQSLFKPAVEEEPQEEQPVRPKPVTPRPVRRQSSFPYKTILFLTVLLLALGVCVFMVRAHCNKELPDFIRQSPRAVQLLEKSSDMCEPLYKLSAAIG